eukprot:TRINITY_DN62213_c0_g1_i1.p1 TRINITY_DN62213_c0_g1~~TRINITY_DN62213_c0_g1_i1.p1  ORF type:complete len:303 (-),score=41.14 TRINITY_DN62213_c0_g1_i1:52-906(-)
MGMVSMFQCIIVLPLVARSIRSDIQDVGLTFPNKSQEQLAHLELRHSMHASSPKHKGTHYVGANGPRTSVNFRDMFGTQSQTDDKINAEKSVAGITQADGRVDALILKSLQNLQDLQLHMRTFLQLGAKGKQAALPKLADHFTKWGRDFNDLHLQYLKISPLETEKLHTRDGKSVGIQIVGQEHILSFLELCLDQAPRTWHDRSLREHSRIIAPRVILTKLVRDLLGVEAYMDYWNNIHEAGSPARDAPYRWVLLKGASCLVLKKEASEERDDSEEIVPSGCEQ